MSIEYYTFRPYDEAKASLLANLGTEFEEVPVPPDRPRYVPECREFRIRWTGPERWVMLCFMETRHRDPVLRPYTPPDGTLCFELFARPLAMSQVFMPWVERVLRIEMLDEVGLSWRLSHRRLAERLNDLGYKGLTSGRPWPEDVMPWKSGHGGVMDAIDSATWDEKEQKWVISPGGWRSDEDNEIIIRRHEARTGKPYPR